VLARGRWLSDIGLHDLALVETEGLGAEAEPRALWAQIAVILARSGERRESIQQLARAFPALGKAQQYRVPADALELYYPLDYRPLIEQRAREQNLSPYLVFAMIRQESAFDASARSWAGARGLMQLMPATGREVAQRLGLPFSTSRLEDPDFSIQLGTRYFRQVLDMFDGNEVLALAGYNGGPYRIKKLWRQAGSNPELDRFLDGLPLEETKTYVKRILLFEDSYNKLYAAGG
jgi:soluble lytic murein transglycosylase-like protein